MPDPRVFTSRGWRAFARRVLVADGDPLDVFARALRFWQRDRQQAISESRARAFVVDLGRQGDTTLELTVIALAVVLTLIIELGMLFAAKRQKAIADAEVVSEIWWELTATASPAG